MKRADYERRVKTREAALRALRRLHEAHRTADTDDQNAVWSVIAAVETALDLVFSYAKEIEESAFNSDAEE